MALAELVVISQSMSTKGRSLYNHFLSHVTGNDIFSLDPQLRGVPRCLRTRTSQWMIRGVSLTDRNCVLAFILYCRQPESQELSKLLPTEGKARPTL